MKLSKEKMNKMLDLPAKGQKLRVVIDTDAKNEIDDQFALAWALMSQDQLEIEGMYAAPFTRDFHEKPLRTAYEQIKSNSLGTVMDGENISWGGSYHDWVRRLLAEGTDPTTIKFVTPGEGTELSYHEILKIYDLLDEDASGKVFRGSMGFLGSLDEPIHSPAVDHLIERAMAHDDQDRPLYVVALAALTNIASAILIEPKIKDRIVVVWTAAYPTFSDLPNRPSMNLVQDFIASQFLFDCGVPHVYLPGFYIGVQLSLSLPDTERWIKGRGKIGDYLHHLYTNNPVYEQRGIREHVGRTWIAWDLINIAWLLNPEWVPSQIYSSPRLDEQMVWQRDGEDKDRHMMREAVGINRDAIFRNLFEKLEKAP